MICRPPDDNRGHEPFPVHVERVLSPSRGPSGPPRRDNGMRPLPRCSHGRPWQQLVADAEGGDVTRGKMFGSEGLRTGTKFFAIWWHEQLVVKLPPARLTELVEAGDGAAVRADGGPPDERLDPARRLGRVATRWSRRRGRSSPPRTRGDGAGRAGDPVT